jgi:uncharacterized membrane protein
MSQQHSRLITVIVAVIGLTLGSETANAQTNYLTDLGAVAPGLGINNSGEVVLQNYIYSHGTLTAFPSGFTGNAINASGEVAGDFPGALAWVYANGALTELASGGSANGINDSGEVIVVNYGRLGIPSSSLVSNGTVVGISVFDCGDRVMAQAINDSGQITGGADSSRFGCGIDAFDAFLYESATGNVTDLGPGVGYAINASGEVTGISNEYNDTCNQEGNCTSEAFLYSNSKLSLIPGTNNCTGYGINAGGFVVGTCAGTAFFYNGVKVTINLDTLVQSTDPLKPYVSLRDARGINDSGLVIVNGIDSRDNSNHAYLLQVSSASSSGSSSGGSSKGGGAFDSLSLIFLLALRGLHQLRRNGVKIIKSQ